MNIACAPGYRDTKVQDLRADWCARWYAPSAPPSYFRFFLKLCGLRSKASHMPTLPYFLLLEAPRYFICSRCSKLSLVDSAICYFLFFIVSNTRVVIYQTRVRTVSVFIVSNVLVMLLLLLLYFCLPSPLLSFSWVLGMRVSACLYLSFESFYFPPLYWFHTFQVTCFSLRRFPPPLSSSSSTAASKPHGFRLQRPWLINACRSHLISLTWSRSKSTQPPRPSQQCFYCQPLHARVLAFSRSRCWWISYQMATSFYS